jgi:very-short-patch-repair endonuclease
MSKKYFGIKEIKKNARELRKNLTESEQILWEHLRNRKLNGYKILRQHPVIYKADFKALHYFVADFYCHSQKAAIELDGPVHEENKEYDEFRDTAMKLKGIRTLRIKNDELNDIEAVKNKILRFLTDSA